VKKGNYGNITVVFDYLFGTVIPESIEHIETGKMPQKIWEKFQDPLKLDADIKQKFKDRNQLDYNKTYDSSIFSFRDV